MKVTTKERMCQLASAASSTIWVLNHYLEKNHPDILNEKVSRISGKTFGEMLKSLEPILDKIGNGNDTNYWADIDIPDYTENSFPRKVSEKS